MKLYRTSRGIILQNEEERYIFQDDWDRLINSEDLHGTLRTVALHADRLNSDQASSILETSLLPPIGSQEVWAAGVTYMRSRDARMEEAREAGGGDFYDKVYDADRPELFFKSQPHRVAGHRGIVCIREDSEWNVPEPELTLFINKAGDIKGYTAGNDMSSRSIEGENPLYLPQAKVYERSAALGPCLFIPEGPLAPETLITMTIYRSGHIIYQDSTPISRMKRRPDELARYLCLGCDFPDGCFLMTGTCVVPDNDFTLMEDDTTEITIEHIGTLVNQVKIFRKKNS